MLEALKTANKTVEWNNPWKLSNHWRQNSIYRKRCGWTCCSQN